MIVREESPIAKPITLTSAKRKLGGAKNTVTFISDDFDNPMTLMNDNKPIEAAVGDMLRERGLVLATAESCTGGLIGERITSVAGSSDYYAGGVIAYSNAAKTALLNVDEAVLAEHGAVSAPAAEAMAAGALAQLNADIAVSTTGIAGPAGGSEDKPVGLVYIGLALCGQPATARKCIFEGNRKDVQMAASQTAFEMIQHCLVSE